jgi:hypothetical protein
MRVEELLRHAAKVRTCVYIAASEECAKDVDKVIGELMALVRALYERERAP